MSRHNIIILKVAVPVPVPRLFDFLPGENKHYAPGCRVLVPFGSRKLLGIIHQICNQSELEPARLKPVIQILDKKPLISDEIRQLAQWCSQYYFHPLGEVYQQILPTLLRGPTNHSTTQTCYQLSDSGQILDLKQLHRAKRQQQLVRLLQQYPQGLSQKSIGEKQAPGWQQAARVLEKKGLIRKITIDRLHTPAPLAPCRRQQTPLQLNPQQQQAIAFLQAHYHGFFPSLLYGVTGSGKTEVYLQFMEPLLKNNKQVLVLVPEINLTPQLAERFSHRFDTSVVLLHSSVGQKQRLDNWIAAVSGHARIIIGTRSAIFTPIPHLGAIIVDEEHDSSFKQQEGFRYHARDLAVLRAQWRKIPVVLGSATPSLESLANALNGRYQLLTLKQRASQHQASQLILLDVRNKQIDHGISYELKQMIHEEISKQHQVLVFQNRRGFSPVLLCHHCGWVARCHQCDANLTVHLFENTLHCHHCEHLSPIPTHCLSCNSQQIDVMGAGTQRIEQTLSRLFPEAEIIRIDRDSTRRKGSFEQLLQNIQQGRGQILVGTQMLAKGHHFPNLTLVVILDVDQGLYSVDFRAQEKMAQLIVQVAGRAGRADKPGRTILQTQQPEHPFFQSLLGQDYISFGRQLLQQRQQSAFPPYSYQALLRASATDEKTLQLFLDQCLQAAQHLCLEAIFSQIQILGPMASPMSRKAGRYRYQILLQAPQRNKLQNFIQHWLATFKPGRGIVFSLDVDPQDMS